MKNIEIIYAKKNIKFQSIKLPMKMTNKTTEYKMQAKHDSMISFHLIHCYF